MATIISDVEELIECYGLYLYLQIQLCTDDLLLFFHHLVPETAPNRLAYYNVTSTSIRLMWQKPTIPNGVITQYTLRYHLTHDDEGINNSNVYYCSVYTVMLFLLVRLSSKIDLFTYYS